MADDKSNRGGHDRTRVSAKQQYEVKYFAQKHRISMAEAREVIQKAGNSRDKANRLVEEVKGKG